MHGCTTSFFSFLKSVDWHPIVPSVVGGLIGGMFALLGGWLAYGYNRRLNENQKRKRIDGVLQAIRCELEILGQFYKQSAGGLLDQIKDGEPFDTYFSLKQQYFIVYPNNTEIVGQIEDGELVKSIVVTYNTANFLIESYLINNQYLDKQQGEPGYFSGLRASRIRQAAIIKQVQATLIRETDNLIAKIDAYRVSHSTKS